VPLRRRAHDDRTGAGIVSLDALLLRFIGAGDPARSGPLVDVPLRAAVP
jgi:hypothetical protein